VGLSRRLGACLAASGLLVGSCSKVPIHDVNAGFVLADAAWFAGEETMFVFYEVTAEQGIGDPSVIEITYATDDERVDWTPISELTEVHTHEPVDCGVFSLCGSTSVQVAKEPREVGIRLLYHRDGELALPAETVFNVVDSGPAHSHRSFVIYGVFDESNQRVQWRGRHKFPTIRNEQATELGLRRDLRITEQRYGSAQLASNGNPYGYGAVCPDGFVDAGLPAVETDERAVFNDDDLPIDASSYSAVCATGTVWDATGEFEVAVVARKNPEVRAAFPELRSPVRDATPVPFFLAPCNDTISEDHESMQRQRLQVGSLSRTCIDDWRDGSFVNQLVVELTDAVEAERANGADMVLVVGLHQDEEGVAEAVEAALSEILPDERHRTSPRLAGAFVFDSDTYAISDNELSPTTLWCPASIYDLLDTGQVPDASTVACAILPENPDLELGPFTFGSLPILPSRELYLDFIDTYSKNQAGEVTELSFRTPEFATTADHVDFGEYGMATFLNDELISTTPADAFSYCTPDTYQLVVFQSEVMRSEEFLTLLIQECASGSVSQEFCDAAALGVLPIEYLGDWHAAFGEQTYELGLLWDFPFLLHMEYEVYTAASVSAFGLSIPFGVAQEGESYLGSALWTQESFPLDDALTQCRRFCDHPTFDSAGVYHVLDAFKDTYRQTCYLPHYPEPGDSGFPSDP